MAAILEFPNAKEMKSKVVLYEHMGLDPCSQLNEPFFENVITGSGEYFGLFKLNET